MLIVSFLTLSPPFQPFLIPFFYPLFYVLSLWCLLITLKTNEITGVLICTCHGNSGNFNVFIQIWCLSHLFCLNDLSIFNFIQYAWIDWTIMWSINIRCSNTWNMNFLSTSNCFQLRIRFDMPINLLFINFYSNKNWFVMLVCEKWGPMGWR